ncbi:MAG: translation initiation factor IF-2 [Euryarchaeota archaeon]|nr:translation initiation factor IF-2 [Euryarchaeota archaeon]
MVTRQPIISVLGHVDHGKTTLLDNVRGSTVAVKEAGGITQHIGATEVPAEVIREICGELLKNSELTIPGVLFIDTPGHEAFTTLRSRGGSLADLAILVIDINEGIQPQTLESINILKNFKVPFIIAANKIDLVGKFRINKKKERYTFMKAFEEQNTQIKEILENKVWELVGDLYTHGFEADRFDRVENFRKKIAIVPCSAEYGIGILEIMTLISGLSQRFLGKQLNIDVNDPAKGNVLEVKEEIGLGMTIDVIIYDGTLRSDDTIILGGKNGVISTAIRSLLKPKPLDEIRDPRFKFKNVDTVSAAAGIKIAAAELNDALAGSPVYAVHGDLEELMDRVQGEIERMRVHTEQTGIILKADTLGSLEALVKTFENKEFSIRKTDVGDVNKLDVTEAISVKKKDMYKGVIVAFNVDVHEEAKRTAEDKKIEIFQNEVIYKIIEDYEDWMEKKKEEERAKKLVGIVKPGKIEILKDYVFRISNPAIVGVRVLSGEIEPNLRLIKKDGASGGKIKSIKSKDDFLNSAEKDKEVAVAIAGVTVGRQIEEGEVLYVDIPESSVRKMEELELDESEKVTLNEFLKIKRKENSLWGV